MIIRSEDKDIEFKDIPTNPGVYIYRDSDGTVIYVGKAKNLRNRVRSYFANSNQHSIKTQHLVAKIKSIDFLIVNNEVEALLLENNLIKKYSPKYNIDLKDSKRYAYIKITDEDYPRIYSTRQIDKSGTFFGPYTDGSARRELVRLVIQVFKIRTCKDLKRPCLNYHIGLCNCHDLTPEQYKVQVDEAKEFLKGGTSRILKRLEEEMENASRDQKYEIAIERKKQIESILALSDRQNVERVKDFDQDVAALVNNDTKALIEIFTISRGVIMGKKEFGFELQDDLFENFLKMYYSTTTIPKEIIVNKQFWETEEDKEILEEYFSRLRGSRVIITHPIKGDKLQLVKLAEKNAEQNFAENSVLYEIKEKLGLPETPNTIECFDISNLGYEHIVGGMTRWVNAKPDKKGYRKFRIKSFEGKNDDFAAMHEMLYRRYYKLKKEDSQLPNLIIIDGGKGQLNAALKALDEAGVQIPIISLAKEHEEIYMPGEELPRQYGKNTRMMLLIRQIRDSVHTFVLAYNRKRRAMKFREETDAARQR